MVEPQAYCYPLHPPKTIHAVICYLEREGDEYLLLLKSKGRFGEGFWNAPGGKIEDGEDAEQAARREVFEETGFVVQDLSHMGWLEFYFGERKRKEPDWTAKVFKTKDFSGELSAEGPEGELRWFGKEQIPFERMWQDDRYWLPMLLDGIRFRGVFEFSYDSKRLISAQVDKI